MTEPNRADVVGEREARAHPLGWHVRGETTLYEGDPATQLGTEHLVTFRTRVSGAWNDGVPVVVITSYTLAGGW